jgi:DDE superfamily endonuclease
MSKNRGKKKEWEIPRLDEKFVEQMMDVLEVYEREYTPEFPVICIDEKNHQLLEQIRPVFVDQHGIYHQDNEYKRQGVAKEFVCLEPKTGRTQIQVVSKRGKTEFAEFVEQVVMHTYASAQKVILVTDQLNIHREQSIWDTYPQDYAESIVARIEWHYTPVHGSWLDQAEIAIRLMSKALLQKRLASMEATKEKVAAYLTRINAHPKPIQWQFTRVKARDKFYLSTS